MPTVSVDKRCSQREPLVQTVALADPGPLIGKGQTCDTVAWGRGLRGGVSPSPLENFSITECPQMRFGATKVYNCEVNFLLKISFSQVQSSLRMIFLQEILILKGCGISVFLHNLPQLQNGAKIPRETQNKFDFKQARNQFLPRLEGVRHARYDYLSGAPQSVGAERTRKFLALQTPQMTGNGTSRVF